MKQIYRHISADLRNFIAVIALVIVGCSFHPKANAQDMRVPLIGDSIHVYLLTCSPHPEVYSLYGHTAIRIVNKQFDNWDWAINYGVFNFNKPFFVARFVFGLTDYEMGIYETRLFKREYMNYGSSVIEQEINMTAEEKVKFMEAVDENYKPENRIYRYNYFYDNCTTRARDIIVNNIDGKVLYDVDAPKEGTTFREMIHEMNGNYPWARLGNDLLLGIGADRQLNSEEVQFLPHSMLAAAEKGYIIDKKGVKRKLVLRQDELIPEGQQDVKSEFPLTPIQCAVIVLALLITASIIEWKKKTYLWFVDGVMLLLQGVCGIALTLMIFSQHPTVSANTQILLFNILPLIFGVQAIIKYRKGRVHWLWLVQAICICLMFLLYSFGVQWLDMSVRLVALGVLLRVSLKFKLIGVK